MSTEHVWFVEGKSTEQQTAEIAERFFDSIDVPNACEDRPIRIANFMEQEYFGFDEEVSVDKRVDVGAIHEQVRTNLLSGVDWLVDLPESNCVRVEEKRTIGDVVVDNETILLESSSGNLLVERIETDVHGKEYGKSYWVCKKDQILHHTGDHVVGSPLPSPAKEASFLVSLCTKLESWDVRVVPGLHQALLEFAEKGTVQAGPPRYEHKFKELLYGTSAV